MPMAAAVGILLLFGGILLDSDNFAILGAVILSPPVAVMLYRLITRPPAVVDTIEMDLGVPTPEGDPQPLSHNEAKSLLRNTGEEKRPK